MEKISFIDMIKEQIEKLQILSNDLEKRIDSIKNKSYEAINKRWLDIEKKQDIEHIAQLQYKKSGIQNNIFALQQAIDIYTFSQKSFKNETDYKNSKSNLVYDYINTIKGSI